VTLRERIAEPRAGKDRIEEKAPLRFRSIEFQNLDEDEMILRNFRNGRITSREMAKDLRQCLVADVRPAVRSWNRRAEKTALPDTSKLGFRRFAGTVPIGRAGRKLARQLAGNLDRLGVGGNASGC
jgi:hypothetical protein